METKALISFAVVTAKLICVFVFAYAKIRFSHVAAHLKGGPAHRGVEKLTDYRGPLFSIVHSTDQLRTVLVSPLGRPQPNQHNGWTAPEFLLWQ